MYSRRICIENFKSKFASVNLLINQTDQKSKRLNYLQVYLFEIYDLNYFLY